VRHARPAAIPAPGGGQLRNPRRWSLEFSRPNGSAPSGGQRQRSLNPPIPFSLQGPVPTPCCCCPQARRGGNRWPAGAGNWTVRDRRAGSPSLGGRWRWDSPPPPARGGAGERRRTRLQVLRQHDGACDPAHPGLAVDPGARTQARRLAAFGLVSRDLEANHQGLAGLPISQENLVALPEASQPVGGRETLQTLRRAAPALCPAQHRQPAWAELPGAAAPRQARQRDPAVLWKRGGGPLHSRNRKAAGRGPCSPSGGELIRAGAGRPACAPLPPRGRSSAGAARQPQISAVSVRWPGPRPCVRHWPDFPGTFNWN